MSHERIDSARETGLASGRGRSADIISTPAFPLEQLPDGATSTNSSMAPRMGQVGGSVKVAEVCRLVLHGPERTVDLSVPVDVRLCDLMPTILMSLGDDLADRGLEHQGWVLQRIGDEALDEDQTIFDLEIFDGESLWLRPRAAQLPPLDFDDLVDGIVTYTAKRSGVWKRQMSTRFGLVTAHVLLLLMVALLVPHGWPAVGKVSLCALAAATASRFALRDVVVTRMLAVVASVAAVVAALLLGLAVSGSEPVPRLTVWLGCLVYAVTVAFAGYALVRGTRLLVANVVGGVTALSFLGAGVWLAGSPALGLAGACALVLGVVLVVRPMIARVAFALAGMRLPELPTTAEAIQHNIDPEPGDRVLRQAAQADRIMTALHAGLLVPATLATAVLVWQASFVPVSAAAAAAATIALSARSSNSLWHRLLGLMPVSAVVLGISARLTLVSSGADVGVMTAVLAAAAAASLLAGRQLAQRALPPGWGRAGDVLQSVSGWAYVPLMLALLGVFDIVRARVG